MGPALSRLRQLLADKPGLTPFEDQLLKDIAAIEERVSPSLAERQIATQSAQAPSRDSHAPPRDVFIQGRDGEWGMRLATPFTTFRISCGEKGCLFDLDKAGREPQLRLGD